VAVRCRVVQGDKIRVQTAVARENLSRIGVEGLKPQRFARNAAAWPAVQAAGSDSRLALALVSRRSAFAPWPTLEKLLAEAIFEEVRLRALPAAPSRLDCVYAVEMGYDAFKILPELGFDLASIRFDASGEPLDGPAILAGFTRGSWVAADMHLFSARELRAERNQVDHWIAETEQSAARYWAGEASANPVTELLCEGVDRPGESEPPVDC